MISDAQGQSGSPDLGRALEGIGEHAERASPVDAPATLLVCEGVTVRFGGITALDGVSFVVPRREICGLIGPNGAGKTTLFNCLSGFYRFAPGRILFDGRNLGELPVHRIAQAGIGRTFQNLALFPTLTVLDNVKLGGHSRTRGGFLANALRLPPVRREEMRLEALARELCRTVGLEHDLHRTVADLPFGVQKRVELARALASEPELLLLDEPAAGLNHEELDGLTDLITRLRDSLDLTILLVEHHMGLVMRLCHRIVALDFGRKIADGTSAEVQRDPAVIRAYLGRVPT